MDFEINNYCRKKTFATLLLVYGALTANAFDMAYTQKMGDYLDHYTALTVLLGLLLASEVAVIFMLTAQMALNVESKEHQKGMYGLANGISGVMTNIFILNIVVAVLNHYSMISIHDKLAAIPSGSS